MAFITGIKCRVSGIYECTNHPTVTITINKGEMFPICPEDGQSTSWKLISKA